MGIDGKPLHQMFQWVIDMFENGIKKVLLEISHSVAIPVAR